MGAGKGNTAHLSKSRTLRQAHQPSLPKGWVQLDRNFSLLQRYTNLTDISRHSLKSLSVSVPRVVNR
jgi:hypothetical protein